MFGIIKRSEPDAEWSWKDELAAPMLCTTEVDKPVLVRILGDIPQTVGKDTRELIMDALCEYPAIKLYPVRK